MTEHIDVIQSTQTAESSLQLHASTANILTVPERLPCTVCQHEIPVSEALVAEVTDYLVYFCGLDCYERWRNQLDR